MPNFTGNFTLNLNQSTNDSWIDTSGQKLTYDETNDVFYFTPLISNYSPCLFDRTGSYIPIEIALSNIGGNWSNPTPINSSSSEFCCVPDSLFITVSGQRGWDINITRTDCYPVDYYAFPMASIDPPGLHNITWTGPYVTDDIFSNYILDPYNASQLTVILASNNNTCWYTYDKVPNNNLINGTWHLDWQSEAAGYYDANIPQNYTISILNGSMEGNLSFTYKPDMISFIVGTSQNLYIDSAMELTFAFDNSTNTLLSFPSPSSPFPVLFSPTGSIVPKIVTLSNWNSPQVYDNGDGECCVPDSILLDISNINEGFVTYTFSSGNICSSIVPYVTPQNQLESTLNITTPNVTLVTWTDQLYSTQISFANTSTTTEIIVSNFAGSGYSFKMSNAPLSGSWMTFEIKSLMILCVVLLFSNM